MCTTGLYYLRSRYYVPEKCRFISSDSILGQTGALLQHNLFCYCSNKPVLKADRDGQKVQKAVRYTDLTDTKITNSMNCWGYVLSFFTGGRIYKNPGDLSYEAGVSDSRLNVGYGIYNTVENVAKFVLRDLEYLKLDARILNNLSEMTQYDYVIALRVETPAGIDSLDQIDYDYDFHFAIMAKKDYDPEGEYQWADKVGLGYNRFGSIDMQEASSWRIVGSDRTRYYDSDIIYIAIGGTLE